MRICKLFIVSIVAFWLVANCARSADLPGRLISVSGAGEVDVPADHIDLTLTITTDDEELLNARAANDKRATAIANVAADQGIKPEQLQTPTSTSPRSSTRSKVRCATAWCARSSCR
jgi:uncharacterized protein YggE